MVGHESISSTIVVHESIQRYMASEQSNLGVHNGLLLKLALEVAQVVVLEWHQLARSESVHELMTRV